VGSTSSFGGPEALGLNPEQRKAAEMTGINLLHVEIERLFGAQFVHAKFKSSHCRLHCIDLGLQFTGCSTNSLSTRTVRGISLKWQWINKRLTTSIAAQVTP
jgi:hypothetical protein